MPVVRPSIQAMIEAIRQQLDDAEAQMTGHVKAHYGELDKLLRSGSGIGPIASATLIAELGKLNRRETAALAGVAPMANGSGSAKGRRRIQGGRFEVRLKTFYGRLLAAGKQQKAALAACMRKLLTVLNAIARTHKPWDESLHGA